MVQVNCMKCHRNFQSRQNHQDFAGEIHCPYCSEVFSSQKLVIKHEQEVHNPRASCPHEDCQEKFAIDGYRRHCLSRHCDQNILCQYSGCGDCFPSYGAYRRHIHTNHQDDVLPVILGELINSGIASPSINQAIGSINFGFSSSSPNQDDHWEAGEGDVMDSIESENSEEPEEARRDTYYYETLIEDICSEGLKSLVRKMDSQLGISRTSIETIFKDLATIAEDWTNAINSILQLKQSNYSISDHIAFEGFLSQPIVKRKSMVGSLLENLPQPEMFSVGLDLTTDKEALMVYRPMKDSLTQLINDGSFRSRHDQASDQLKELKNHSGPLTKFSNLHNEKMKAIVDSQDKVDDLLLIAMYSDGVDFSAHSCRKTSDGRHVNMTYISVLNLEHQYTRTEKHWIFVSGYEEKHSSRDRVYLRFCQEANQLFLDGLKANDGKKFRVRFTLMTGDMLERQSVLGIMKNGAFGCPVTYLSLEARTNAKSALELENQALPRNPEDYANDIETLMTTVPRPEHVRGVKNICFLNSISGYNFTEFGSQVNCTGHDVYCGAANLDCAAVIHLWVKTKLISDGLVTEAFSQTKAMLRKKDRTEFPGEHVSGAAGKNFKLHGNIAQNQYLLRYFTTTFIHLAKEKGFIDTTSWKLMLVWMKFAQYLECNEMSKSMLDNFTTLKRQLLELRIKLKLESENLVSKNLSLKPKHGSLVFYDRLIMALGPLKNYSTLPMERKHNGYKSILNKKTNFTKSIIHGLAQKEVMRSETLNEEGRYSREEISFGKRVSSEVIKSLTEIEVQLCQSVAGTDAGLAIQSVTLLQGSKIERDQVIAYHVNNKSKYDFGIVKLVLPCPAELQCAFLVAKILTHEDVNTGQIFIIREVEPCLVLSNSLASPTSQNVYKNNEDKEFFVLRDIPYQE